MSDKRSFLKGTLIGAIIGAVAGILLAPKSGKETQADIKSKALSLKGDVDDKVDQVRSDLTLKLDELKTAAKDLSKEAKEESQDLVRRAETLKTDLKVSADSLTKATGAIKDSTITDAKRLVDEGTAVMKELERLTKKIAGSAKQKLQDND